MSRFAPHHAPALSPEEADGVRRALGAGDITVFADGTAYRLPDAARDAVLDLLGRLGRGESVTVTSAEDVLTVAQAAELAGISHSYVRKLTDLGTWPVEYRGTHRRIRREDVLAWLAAQKKGGRAPGSGADPGADQGSGPGSDQGSAGK